CARGLPQGARPVGHGGIRPDQQRDRPAARAQIGDEPGRRDRRGGPRHTRRRAPRRAAACTDPGACRLAAGLPGFFQRLRRHRPRGVVVTVAGPGGAALDPDGETIANLAAVLRGAGNRYVPVTVLPYQAKRFEVAGLVRVDTDSYDPARVLAAVRAALLAAFGFDARALGQGVAQSEVIAAIQAVPGVQGARLNRFSRADVVSVLPDNLPAAAPQAGARGVVAGAELLLLDPLSLPSVEQWP